MMFIINALEFQRFINICADAMVFVCWEVVERRIERING